MVKQTRLKVTYPHKQLVGVMASEWINGWEVECILTAQLPCTIDSFIGKILARTLEQTFETGKLVFR
jgi:hypothetical protein